jgi:hypothetical protein
MQAGLTPLVASVVVFQIGSRYSIAVHAHPLAFAADNCPVADRDLQRLRWTATRNLTASRRSGGLSCSSSTTNTIRPSVSRQRNRNGGATDPQRRAGECRRDSRPWWRRSVSIAFHAHSLAFAADRRSGPRNAVTVDFGALKKFIRRACTDHAVKAP